MDKFLSCFYDFVFIFLLVYIVYSVFLNKNKHDYKKLQKNDMIKIFIARYNLDVKKTKYENILKIVTFINSFIISFSAVLVINIDSMIWSILISFVVIMALIYSLYEIAGRLLKKKEGKRDVRS